MAKSVKLQKFFKPSNKQGMSLIEVLIGLAMAGILSMVIASILETMSKSQRQTNIKGNIEQLKTSIIRNILDKESWSNTIENATNMAAGTQCIADGTPCSSSPAPANPMTLAFAQANLIPLTVLHDGAPSPDTGDIVNTTAGTNGFTQHGTSCTTFNSDATVGSDDCPIRYDLFAHYQCGATNPCINPTVTVYGILRFRPNPNSSLRSVINENNYLINITRGDGNNYLAETISIVYQTGQGVSGGPCNPGNWTTIPVSFEEIDTGDNVNNDSFPGGVMTFQPGTYTCNATATCFACQTVRVRVVVGGAAPQQAESPAAMAPQWINGQAVLNGYQFVLSGPTGIQIQQFCATHPGGISTAPEVNLGLGMALPTSYDHSTGASSYTGVSSHTHARISCLRTQ